MKKCLVVFVLMALLISCMNKTNQTDNRTLVPLVSDELDIISCVNKTNQTDDRTLVLLTSDELDIINYLIKRYLYNEIRKAEKIFINNNINAHIWAEDDDTWNTEFESTIEFLQRGNIDTDLVNSFQQNNKRYMVLDKNTVFDFNFSYTYDPEHPYPWIEFSKAGFNKEKTKAIIYLGIMYGFLWGQGCYFMLEKENGEWKYVDAFMT